MNLMNVTVVADSISPEGKRLTTVHARYPRIIHAEVMTHRVFSRNARSSRAVPVAKMLDECMTAPFVPWHWTANQPGMQGVGGYDAPVHDTDEWVLDDDRPVHLRNSPGVSVIEPPPGHFEPVYISREETWLGARDAAVATAQKFTDAGYHKQVANRLLEPFMYIDTLISSTEWNNFFFLRDHEAAEPHFHDLAAMIFDAINASTPRLLNPGEWHLPYVTDKEFQEYDLITRQKLSVARSARISYAPFDGNASIEKELERYDLLVGSEPLHASPAEHQATPDFYEDTYSAEGDLVGVAWFNRELHGNFNGFIQFRKTLKNEYVPG